MVEVEGVLFVHAVVVVVVVVVVAGDLQNHAAPVAVVVVVVVVVVAVVEEEATWRILAAAVVAIVGLFLAVVEDVFDPTTTPLCLKHNPHYKALFVSIEEAQLSSFLSPQSNNDNDDCNDDDLQ